MTNEEKALKFLEKENFAQFPWKDHSRYVANLLVKFRKELADEIVRTMEKGIPNMKYLKSWESKIMELCKDE